LSAAFDANAKQGRQAAITAKKKRRLPPDPFILLRKRLTAPNRFVRQAAVRGAMWGIGQAPQHGRRADLAHRKPGQTIP